MRNPLKYVFKLFTTPRFWSSPVKTAYRALCLCILIVLKRGASITVPFGSTVFKFKYRHGKRHQGGRGIFLFRSKIEDLMEFGDRFMRHGSICIDGGANQGIYTLAFANYVGDAGKVVAIEPMPYACEYIKDNLALNNLNNVTVLEKAISDSCGTATLDLTGGVGSASISREFGGKDVIQVDTITIDKIFKQLNLSTVDFVKLDIEGAEVQALHGAMYVLEKFRPVVCLEVTDLETASANKNAHELIMSLGYSPYVFSAGKLVKAEPFEPPYMNVFYLVAAG